MSKVLAAIMNETWAIQPSALRNIVNAVTGDGKGIEAIEKELGRELNNTFNTEIRGGVAKIPIHGPLVMKGNMFTQVSGLTSYEMVAIDFNSALNNPEVKSIVFAIHSPGGMVDGVSELADMIHEARGQKPIVSYVEGIAASAAYWIAAATDRIVLADTSQVGSLGAMARLMKSDSSDVIEIISEQTPLKNAAVETEAGKREWVSAVNYSADIFISKIAAYREVSTNFVLENYGKGGMLIGARAVDSGVADEVSTYERLLTSLQTDDNPTGKSAINRKESIVAKKDDDKIVTEDDKKTVVIEKAPDVTMAYLDKNHSNLVADIKSAANLRAEQILGCTEATGREDMAKHLAFKTSMPAEDATALLETAPTKASKSTFEEDMGAEKNIDVGESDKVVSINDGWGKAMDGVSK